jgi:hypothetical protein
MSAREAVRRAAMSAPAGQLVDRNPFAKLALRQSRGRRDTQPPTQAEISRFVALAGELTPPSFAAYLDVAVHEGMRFGELDALRWTKIDFQAGTVLIDEQWNAIEHAFTLPKHGFIRTIALTDAAHERLLRLPHESEFVFTTIRGSHYRPSSRSHHWNRVRCAAGLGNVDLYTATRHYFGWYAWNVLELDARDIALHFGHRDGGELVRKLYGHADAKTRTRACPQRVPTGTDRARPARRCGSLTLTMVPSRRYAASARSTVGTTFKSGTTPVTSRIRSTTGAVPSTTLNLRSSSMAFFFVCRSTWTMAESMNSAVERSTIRWSQTARDWSKVC